MQSLRPNNYSLHSWVLMVWCILAIGGFSGRGFAAQRDPSGHWEGAVKLQMIELGIRVDLKQERSDSWSGTIDIPVQAIRGGKLAQVTVKERNVGFRIADVPGEPQLAGELAVDGETI